jgi:hypothetical protein
MESLSADEFAPKTMEAAMGRISLYAREQGLTPREVADTFNAGILVMVASPSIRPAWVDRIDKREFGAGPD